MASFSGSGRGGWAPRRGRGRGGRAPHFAKNRELPKPDLQTHPLGDPVKVFRSSDLSLKPIDSAEISNCQHVASYNWLNDEVPTIVVPGKPPRWTPLQAPQRLKEDDGQYFRDPNAAKYPDFPMAPVVHAITETDPEFDATNTDVFACGSTLGNLLRFARGVDKAFRFNIEVIGETVFFVRKENDPKEVIKDIRGFGHTFPEAYTTWEHSVKGSETHQRIIRYEFGGLECLVRFESDGYIDDSLAVRDVAPAQTAGDQDELLQAFQQAAIGRSPSNAMGKPEELKIEHRGSTVPHHSIFDLKTRSGKYKKPIDMTDIYPALWMKQISNFIVAYHDGHGLFEDIQVQDVKKDVRAWVRENRDGIRRFATLLNEIVDIAKSSTNKLLEVYCPGADRLEVRNQYGDGVHALPADLVDRWEKTQVTVSSTQDDASDEDEYSDGGVDLNARYGLGSGYDSESEPDYTACSANDCGYCGKFGKTFCDELDFLAAIPISLLVNEENKKQIGKDAAVIYRDELVSRLQHIQDLNSALHGLLQKTCTTPTNVSNSELEQFQQKVKDQDYFYETIAMLSTHVQSIRMELQHLGAQVGAALLLTDFNPEYFPQWDIEKRTAHPLTTAINNASRDTVHLPGFNDVYDQFDVAFNEEDVKIPLEDKPSSDNLVRKLRDIVPVLETDDRKMSRRSHSKMPKKEVENTDEGIMMDGEMSDHESLQPKLKYTMGRHAKKYEISKGRTKFYFVLHMIKNGEKRTRGSTTIHTHHMVPHFAVMLFDSKYTSSRCPWRCTTTHIFGFGAGFVAYIAGNLKAPPAAMFLRFEVVAQVLTKSEQQQHQ